MVIRGTIIRFVAVYGILLHALIFLIYLRGSSVGDAVYTIVVVGLMTSLSVLISKLLKRIIKKKRPRVPLFEAVDSYAFPSSHAAGLITITGVFLFMSLDYFVLMSAATLMVLVARVLSRVHDILDMVGGGMLAGVILFVFIEPVSVFSHYIVDMLL